MFGKLIKEKKTVQIFDHQLKPVISGKITGFNAERGLIKINHSLVFPVGTVAKIQVLEDSQADRRKSVGM